MRKTSKESKPEIAVRDGVPRRIRFRDEKQISLIEAAAKRRGLSRDRFIQNVLQAAAEYVVAEPLSPTISEITRQLLASDSI